MLLWYLIHISTIYLPCLHNYSLDKFEHSSIPLLLHPNSYLPPSPPAYSTVPCTSLCTMLNLPFPSAAPSLPTGSACVPPLQKSWESSPNNPWELFPENLFWTNWSHFIVTFLTLVPRRSTELLHFQDLPDLLSRHKGLNLHNTCNLQNILKLTTI